MVTTRHAQQAWHALRPFSLLPIVVVASAMLMQTLDTGIAAYADDLAYLTREGVSVWPLVAFKFVFMAAVTICLLARPLWVRVPAYAFTFVCLWLSGFNLAVNNGPVSEEVIRIALGDVTTRAYIGAAAVQFGRELAVSGVGAVLVLATLVWMNRRLLPTVPAWVAVTPLVLVCAGYFGIRGPGYQVTQMPVPVKLPGLVYAHVTRPFYHGPRDPVVIDPTGTGLQRLVLIVDESVRGDLLSMNGFGLPTTPYLDRIASSHFNYGVAVSGTNSSASANILLQTGVTSAQVPDQDFLILHTPSIFSYARRAGYRTFYVPVRGRPGQYADFMSKFDFDDIDEAVYIRHEHPDAPRTEVDALLAQEIARIIEEHPDERVFIYALKEGNHFLYRDAYPREAARFPDDTGRDPEDLRNGYYNALGWVVDRFFEDLLRDLDGVDSTIVYTSDHGQGLWEEGDHSTHGKPMGPLPVQANVPFTVFATGHDHSRVRELAEPALQHNYNRVSHANIFPSLLVLMGYDQSAVGERYATTVFEPLRHVERSFLSGDLWGKAYKNPFGPEVGTTNAARITAR